MTTTNNNRDFRMNNRVSRLKKEVIEKIQKHIEHGCNGCKMHIYLSMRETNLYLPLFYDKQDFMSMMYRKSKEFIFDIVRLYPDTKDRFLNLIVKHSYDVINKYHEYYITAIKALEEKTPLPTDTIVFEIMEFAGFVRPMEFMMRY